MSGGSREGDEPKNESGEGARCSVADRPDRRLALWGLALLVAFGFGVRLFRLGNAQFWFDEYATYVFASEPMSRIWGPDARAETNPPLYYAAQHLWLALGDSRLVMRTLPVLGGVASIIAAFFLGRVLLGWKAGLVTAALLAASPAHIHFSREIRCYSWLVAFCVLGLIALANVLHRALQRQENALDPGHQPSNCEPGRPFVWLAVYAAASVIAIYLHNTAVLFPLVASFIFLCMMLRREVPRSLIVGWTIANLLVLAAASWWLVTVAEQANGTLRNFTWMPPPSAEVLYTRFATAYDYHWSVKLVTLGLAVIGAWRLRYRLNLLLFLGAVAVGQPLLVALISLWRPIFITRVILWPTVAVFVLVAAALASIRSPGRFVVAAVLLMGAQLAVVGDNFLLERKESGIATLVARIESESAADDLVLFYPLEEIDFEYQYEARRHPLGRPRLGVRDSDASYQLDVWCTTDQISLAESLALVGGARDIWVLTYRDTDDAHLHAMIERADSVRQWKEGDQGFRLYRLSGRRLEVKDQP